MGLCIYVNLLKTKKFKLLASRRACRAVSTLGVNAENLTDHNTVNSDVKIAFYGVYKNHEVQTPVCDRIYKYGICFCLLWNSIRVTRRFLFLKLRTLSRKWLSVLHKLGKSYDLLQSQKDHRCQRNSLIHCFSL